MRPSSRMRRRALLAVIGGIVAVAGAEIVVRMLGFVREVGPSFTEWHATDGVHIRRGIAVTRTTPEYTMRFTANSAGYRGPELPAVIERSLLLLGDSFTMGYGVDDCDVFARQLAPSMPAGCVVVNAGVGGTGNARWLHVLDRERERLRPAVVVLQVCSNDIDDNLREALFALDGAGGLIVRAPAAPSLVRRVQGWIDAVPGMSYLHLVGLGRQFGAQRAGSSDVAGGPPPAAGPGLELTLALLRAAIGRVRELGALPLLLSADQSAEQLRPVGDVAAALDVPVLRVPCRAERPDLYYRVDGHWNAAGHRHVAECLAAQLTREPFASRLSGGAKAR